MGQATETTNPVPVEFNQMLDCVRVFDSKRAAEAESHLAKGFGMLGRLFAEYSAVHKPQAKTPAAKGAGR